MGIIKGVLKEILRFLIGLLKQWLMFIVQAAGVVAALVFSPYVQYGPDVRQDAIYFIYTFAASVAILRIAYRDKRWTIQFARQFFKFMQWFLAVLASILAPFVPGFFPFLTLPGIVTKLAIILVILLLLLFTGIFLGLGEIFKRVEDDWVMAFEKRLATPDYEAILMGEEFEHHPKPPRTRRERLRKWWEREKKLYQQYIRKLKADP